MHAGDSTPRALSLAALSLGCGRAYTPPHVHRRSPHTGAVRLWRRTLASTVRWATLCGGSSILLARRLPGSSSPSQVCKAKLGSHKRAKSKREDMAESMRQARMADKK
eukprot:scaffold27696_cov60-Phaeocystis_antarctica.AAC.4